MQRFYSISSYRNLRKYYVISKNLWKHITTYHKQSFHYTNFYFPTFCLFWCTSFKKHFLWISQKMWGGGCKKKTYIVQIIQNQNYASIFIKALSYLLYIQQMFFNDISNIKCPSKTIIEIFIIFFFSILFFLVKFVKILIFIISILYPISYN